MTKRKVLHIISERFPFGTGEQFFEAEVHEMATHFDEVVLYPLGSGQLIKELPANVFINDVLVHTDRSVSKLLMIKNSGLITKMIGLEILKNKQRTFIIFHLKRWMVAILQCQHLAKAFEQTINDRNENYFYSFWMNDGALLLSILKQKKRINNFSFRVNGYDIFSERHTANYLPFRTYNYKYVSNIFVLSNGGLNYLKGLNIANDKLVLAHYGIYPNGINHLNEQNEVVRIVSCANVIPLKRIDKIIDALTYIEDIEVEWIHFGDGDLMSEIQTKALQLSPNIIVDFRGNRPNREVLEVYKTQSVNLFIHTSETEGLGMAIVEAQSFGIPAVVIGVGGVLDIVSNETGRVLAPNAGGKQISEAISKVLASNLNSNAYRQSIQTKCLAIFNAKKNYQMQFDRMITNQ